MPGRKRGGDSSPDLAPDHLADLRRSGLTDATIRAAGLYTERDPQRVSALLGWDRPATALGPCLVFPYAHPDGSRNGYARLKPSRPRTDKRAGKRERTREKFGTVFDVFEGLCNPRQIGTVTERTLSVFVRRLREKKRPGGRVGLAPVTIKNYLIGLKTALGWAVKQKLIAAVPAFPDITVPKKKPQPVPAEAFERLLDAAPNDHWRAFLLCGWWCGLRLSEARHLRRARSDRFPWLDLDNDRIALPAEFAKSNDDQWVPLHPMLREALEALPATGDVVFPFRSQKTGEPLTRNGITNRVILMAKRAGVKLSMHRLRKGFGCRVARQLGKGNAPILHRLMRHSSMQITMDYYANVDDVLHDAIRELT
jgi:integrase